MLEIYLDHKFQWPQEGLKGERITSRPSGLGNNIVCKRFAVQIFPVVTGICDPIKSRARQHRSLKLGSKLKYVNFKKSIQKRKLENGESSFWSYIDFWP